MEPCIQAAEVENIFLESLLGNFRYLLVNSLSWNTFSDLLYFIYKYNFS